MSFMLLPLWFLATVAHIWYAFLHAKWKVSFSLSAGNRPEKHRCCWLMICLLNALLISLPVHHPHVQKHLHLCPFLHLGSKHSTASRLIINQSISSVKFSSLLEFSIDQAKKRQKRLLGIKPILLSLKYFGISGNQDWLLGVEISTGLTPTIAHFMCSAAAVESQQEEIELQHLFTCAHIVIHSSWEPHLNILFLLHQNRQLLPNKAPLSFKTFTITTKLSLRKHPTPPSKRPSFSFTTFDIQNLCFSSQTPNSWKTPIFLLQHLTFKNYSSLIEHPTPPAKHPHSFTTFGFQELFFSNQTPNSSCKTSTFLHNIWHSKIVFWTFREIKD
jgi:hypothetical protein